ncbi:MAG TPA: redox-regulated ATPase YchF [Syntrophomonadaceae bacterium]|nr:redox-regulated ATPase YchF [Syntrophomonadaceae bacterium]HNX28689.1 redox-regulated ATPase YchF [Syntrophomonadaceae bacterium]HPR93513.1 redox-regulated ATPase YchF [Syntrophomonadaceae bacterium]
MQLGIIGLPSTGKTSIFELLTNQTENTAKSTRPNLAIARIPDQRIDFLSDLYKPKKTTYAQLEIIDVPSLVPGMAKNTAQFLDSVRKADALLQIVRVFENENVPSLSGAINPLKDIETINYELLLADLDLIEKRIQRINENKKKNTMLKELALLEKIKGNLENGIPISSFDFDDEETELLSNYQFLTSKPMLICLNISEDVINDSRYKGKDDVYEYARLNHINLIEVSASIEKEIAELDEEDKKIYMQEIGIEESGVVKIARIMYGSLGLISFFTVGEDEVKAWTISENTIARKAAGKIHSDIERGFIRAEVIKYDDLKELKSVLLVKDKGLFKLEGKEYVVKDGDIINFRFNI